MKNLIPFLIVALFVSCSKEPELIQNHFEYAPDQPLSIVVEVIPTEDVEVDLHAMGLEANADYFNRWGINLEFQLKEREMLSDNVKYHNEILLPQHISQEIKTWISVYVIPREYIYFDAHGYANTMSKSVVVAHDAQTMSVIAHEIAHIFGLGHLNEYNNLMEEIYAAGQYDVPKDLNEAQIDTMQTVIKKYFLLNQ